MKINKMWIDNYIKNMNFEFWYTPDQIIKELEKMRFLLNVTLENCILKYDQGSSRIILTPQNATKKMMCTFIFNEKFIKKIRVHVYLFHTEHKKWIAGSNVSNNNKIELSLGANNSTYSQLAISEINYQVVSEELFLEQNIKLPVTTIDSIEEISYQASTSTKNIDSDENNFTLYSVPNYYINNHRLSGWGNLNREPEENFTTTDDGKEQINGYNYSNNINYVNATWNAKNFHNNQNIKYWNFSGHPYIIYNNFYTDESLDLLKSHNFKFNSNMWKFNLYSSQKHVHESFYIMNYNNFNLVEYKLIPIDITDILKNSNVQLELSTKIVSEEMYQKEIEAEIKSNQKIIEKIIDFSENNLVISCLNNPTLDDKNWKKLFSTQNLTFYNSLNKNLSVNKEIATIPSDIYGAPNTEIILRNININLPSVKIICKNWPKLNTEETFYFNSNWDIERKNKYAVSSLSGWYTWPFIFNNTTKIFAPTGTIETTKTKDKLLNFTHFKIKNNITGPLVYDYNKNIYISPHYLYPWSKEYHRCFGEQTPKTEIISFQYINYDNDIVDKNVGNFTFDQYNLALKINHSFTSNTGHIIALWPEIEDSKPLFQGFRLKTKINNGKNITYYECSKDRKYFWFIIEEYRYLITLEDFQRRSDLLLINEDNYYEIYRLEPNSGNFLSFSAEDSKNCFLEDCFSNKDYRPDIVINSDKTLLKNWSSYSFGIEIIKNDHTSTLQSFLAGSNIKLTSDIISYRVNIGYKFFQGYWKEGSFKGPEHII